MIYLCEKFNLDLSTKNENIRREGAIHLRQNIYLSKKPRLWLKICFSMCSFQDEYFDINIIWKIFQFFLQFYFRLKQTKS